MRYNEVVWILCAGQARKLGQEIWLYGNFWASLSECQELVKPAIILLCMYILTGGKQDMGFVKNRLFTIWLL